jgi:hypothetical protein
MMYILFAVLKRLRETRLAWAMLDSGKQFTEIQSALRASQGRARIIVSQAKGMDGSRFERAFELLAEVDWAVRGGGRLDPDSTLTLALAGVDPRGSERA